jgi:hypothetical protein
MEPRVPPATAAALYAEMKAQYRQLAGVERTKFRALIQADGWLMFEVGVTVIRERNRFREAHSRRARSADTEFNAKVMADKAAGMSYTKLAAKHKRSVDAIKGILRRGREKAAGYRPA